MQLVNIELTNYRKYHNAEISFPDGLIGIVGPNGVGKSTLMEAMAWALYGNAASRTQKEEIKRQGAPLLEPCQVCLRLRFAGNEYVILRSLKGKELATEAFVLANKREVARGAQATTAFVRDLLGLDREAFFTSFFAKQKELNALSELTPSSRKDLIIKMLGIDAIDRAVDSARQTSRDIKSKTETLKDSLLNVEETEKKLKEKKKVLAEKKLKLNIAQDEKYKKADILKMEKTNFEEQEKRKARHTKILQEYTLKKREWALVKESVKEKNRIIRELKKSAEQYKNLKPTIEEYEKIKIELEKLNEVKSKYHLLQELKERWKLLKERDKESQYKLAGCQQSLTELGSVKSKVEEINRKIERLEEERLKFIKRIQIMENQISITQKEKNKIYLQLKELDTLGPEAVCPTCQRLLGNDFPDIRRHLEEELSSLISSIDNTERDILTLKKNLQQLESEIREVKQREKEVKEQEQEMALLVKEASEISNYLTQNQREIEQIENRLRELNYLSFNPTLYQELKDRFDNLSKKRDLFLKLKTTLQKLPETEKQLADLQHKQKLLLNKIAFWEKEKEKLSFSLQEYEASKMNFQNAQQAYHQAELELKDRTHEYRLLGIEIDSLEQEIEKQRNIQKEIGNLTNEHQHLEKLIAIFQDFRKYLIGKIRPALAQKASDLFSELTEGKYREIELNEDYDVLVYDRNEKFSLERFSGGEKDLVNLCLRLAISDLVTESTGSEFGFIVLDEVFGSQDPERKSNIMKALSRLSNKFRQIFLITHIEDVKEEMEHVITVYEDEDNLSYAKLE